MKTFSASFAREMAKRCFFDETEKRQWPRRRKKCPCNGVVVLFGTIIAPFSSSTVMSSEK